MRVKIRTNMAGPAGAHLAGSIVNLDQAQAYDLIERGFALQVEDAMGGPVETAEAPANRRRKNRPPIV